MSVKRKPVIFFLSKSGAGKDTQADLIIERLGFDSINTGDLLRKLEDPEFLAKLKKNSVERYEARGVSKILDHGGFVSTIAVVYHWRNALLSIVKNQKKSRGVVFVGVARKLGEAMALHDFFETWPDAKKYFRMVPVYLDVSDREVHARLARRRQCVGCKKVFPGVVDIAEKTTVAACYRCGGHLVRRKDDTPTAIASRLREYRKYAIPVLNYFRKNKMLITVNGEQSIEQVHREVMRKLGL